MSLPSHYKLISEAPNHYEIHDERDGRSFQIAKQGLDLKMHGELSKIKHFAKGGEASLMDGHESAPLQSVSPDSLNSLGAYALPTSSQLPVLQSPEAQTPQPQLPKVEPINDFQANRIQKTSALEDERAAIQAGAKAEGQLGLDTAKLYEDYVKEAKKGKSPFKIHEEYTAKNEKLRTAYEAKELQPYWENKSTGAKISAALGLILGGIGAGKGENEVLKQINLDIDRDINRQKNSQSKIMNLYKMNLEAEGNEQKAYLETRNMALHAVQAEALGYAARVADPIAKARIAPAIAALNAEIAQNTLQRSLLAGASGGKTMDLDPSRLVPTMVPKDHQAAAYKEIEEMKNLKTLKENMMESFDHLNSLFAKGMFSPADRASAVNAFSGRLVKLAEGSFTKEQAEQFAESFFPNRIESPATTKLKEERLNKMFESLEKGSVFSQSGLDLKNFSSTALGEGRGEQEKKAQLDYVRKNVGSKDPQVQKRVNFIRSKYGG